MDKCEHTFEVIETRQSTGENILGVTVTAWIEDIQCNKCYLKTLRLAKS
jgi:hypothetical protein